MDFEFGKLLGGIGLFLLGMSLMTDGLKSASGPMLVTFLEKATNTRLKGFFAGFISTAILQSSTTTTMLTIGFVNAGILAFSGSLWLIFGANVGSTVTTWIIAFVGMKLNMTAFALPMIGIGIALKMMSKKKIGFFGSILAGFGLLFMGIDFLQESFKGIDSVIPFQNFTNHGLLSWFIFLLAGIILTIIMQSSAAVMAVILSLAIGINLPIYEAASFVIGSNVGTTATAFFASIGATANAKRTSWAHILFNVITASVIFCFLPFFLSLTDIFMKFFGMDSGNISDKLTFFHTIFNITGVLLMIPIANYLAKFLLSKFTKDEAKIEKPQYLDENLIKMPALALEALAKELERQRDFLVTTARGFIAFARGKGSVLPTVKKIDELDSHIAKFASEVSKSELSEEDEQTLAELLEVRHQYQKSKEYLKNVMDANKNGFKTHKETEDNMEFFLKIADELLEYIEVSENEKPKNISKRKLEEFYEKYQNFKKELVEETIEKHLSIEEMERLSQLARTIKTMIFSLAKAQKITIAK